MGKRLIILGFFFGILFLSESVCALAFPGAEGYGAIATGGRGGRVIIVDTLDDVVANDGRTSFREAITTSGARIVVFNVSGYIDLNSNIYITRGDLTIAGQTAPGDGITVRNYGVYIQANNVIVRYIRFRKGDLAGDSDDCISGLKYNNVILDHVSVSWGTDECMSFYGGNNLTIQWSIISECLISEGFGHGYGGIWGGSGSSYHHNLFAHNYNRNPNFGTGDSSVSQELKADFRNNAIYNWGAGSSYGGTANQGVNFVNNYVKTGPATDRASDSRIPRMLVNPRSVNSKWYITGNYMWNQPTITQDNWEGVIVWHASGFNKEEVRSYDEFPYSYVSTSSATQAYEDVLNKSGTSYPKRDSVDTRIINEVRTGTAIHGYYGIIDSQNDVGGWPVLTSLPAPLDSDDDGMPDYWEDEQGLDKDIDDSRGDINNDGYTNIENYINELVDGDGPPTQYYSLSVSKTGEGSGLVTSNDGGINCGSDCTQSYVDGVAVTLTATADSESSFVQWLDDCTGSGNCNLVINENKNVRANFSSSSYGGNNGTQGFNAFIGTNNFFLDIDGNYSILGYVRAPGPSDDNNSFFIDVDSNPGTDNSKVWDLDVNNNYNYQNVSWRGPDGNYTDADFDPRVFELSAGQHVLYINEREAGTEIQSVRFVKIDDEVDEENSCDLNDEPDGIVNIEDIVVIVSSWGPGGEHDFNSDGTVNLLDIMFCVKSWSQ